MSVEIYTKATCGYCFRAKMLLDQLQISYREIAIDHDPELRDEMIARSAGGYTVPQIFIDDKPIGGCDDLFSLHHQNRLETLLGN
jgi:glutaredoxin 3